MELLTKSKQKTIGSKPLDIFFKITEIPRPTKGEQKIANWISKMALKNEWEVQQDVIGNLLIIVPATNGSENSESVCLQTHLDMVCEDSNGKSYGDEKYPLKLTIDGDWLGAKDTTLGADNGIGVALALSLAIHEEHGPLELLFTVQEEVGLVGATKLELELKSKKLINIDSENFGVICNGCAGGVRADVIAKLSCCSFDNKIQSHKIEVNGLGGGHSGLKIHENRANAICVMAKILDRISSETNIFLSSLEGGSKTNLIPTSCTAIISTRESISEWFDEISSKIKEEFQSTDLKMEIQLYAADKPAKFVAIEPTKKLIEFLLALPHGVQNSNNGFPITSVNLATVKTDLKSGEMTIQLMPRSSLAQELEDMKIKLRQKCREFNGNLFEPRISFHNQYPEWGPVQNPLIETAKRVWSNILGSEPNLVQDHAGVECGILSLKMLDVDMMCVGPDIKEPHTVNEKVSISTVNSCYKFLKDLLPVLAKE